MMKGWFCSENSVTATKASSTNCETSSARLSSLSMALMLRSATTALNSEISQAQNSSEPARPPHRPETLYSQPKVPSASLR